MANLISKSYKLTKMGIGTIAKYAGPAMGLYFGYDWYRESREAGVGTIGAVTRAVGLTALYSMFPAAAFILWGGQLGWEAGVGMYKKYKEMNSWLATAAIPGLSTNYVDTQGAFTSRQRAMQLMQSSSVNNFIGNEAVFYHR